MGDAIRRAYRNLRSGPGFWLTATLSLSIGIGGNLAMFTVINAVILRPLPFPDSDRLVLITQASKYSTPYNPSTGLAPVEFIHRRDGNQWQEHDDFPAGIDFERCGSKNCADWND